MAASFQRVIERTFKPALPYLVSCRLQSSSPRSGEMIMNVFDRKAKRLHRDRTTTMSDYKVYEYVKEEVCIIIKTITKIGLC